MRIFFTVVGAGLCNAALLFAFRLSNLLPLVDELVAVELGKKAAGTVVSSDGSLLLGVVLGLFFAWVAQEIPPGRKRWSVALLASFLTATCAMVLALYGVVFSPIAPSLGILGGTAFAALLTGIGPGAFRRRVDEAFGNSLAGKSLRSLYGAPSSFLVLPERRRVSALVVRLCGDSASMEPAMCAEMHRVYMTCIADFLAEAGAFIESCGGLSVRAIFGAPCSLETPSVFAAKAALDLQRRVERMNLEADARWQRILDVRMGICTGDAVIGFFGAHRGRGYAVAGVVTETAGRLANACARYGCRALACMETQRDIADSFEVRPIDLVAVAGSSESEIYELQAVKDGISPERRRSRDHFWCGVTFYRAGKYEEAVAEFSLARIPGLPDGPLDFYLQRIAREKAGSPAERAHPSPL